MVFVLVMFAVSKCQAHEPPKWLEQIRMCAEACQKVGYLTGYIRGDACKCVEPVKK